MSLDLRLLHIVPVTSDYSSARESVHHCVHVLINFFFTSLICSLTSVSILGAQRLFFSKPIILLGPFSGCHSICLFDTLWKDKSKNVCTVLTTKEIMGMFTVSLGQSYLAWLFQTEAKAPCKKIIRKYICSIFKMRACMVHIFIFL